MIADSQLVNANKEAYFRLMDALNIDIQAVSYEDDGKAALLFTR